MSELLYEDLERYINEISAGQKLVFIEDNLSEEKALLFKQPSLRNKDLSIFIYRQALKEAEGLELPSFKEMQDLIEERHLFSDSDKEQLGRLESKLEGQRAILAKTTRVPARRERLVSLIEDLEKQILALKLKKESLFEFTRERKAAEDKLLFLSWCGTHDPFTENLYWATYDDFKGERDFLFRKRVFVEYALYFYGLDQKIIRQIARSVLWRIRYVNSLKTNESLFGRAVLDYTTDQIMLCYWSNFYQSVYDMMSDDRPPDSVIEDDAALDAYMKDWAAEKNRDNTASQSKKSKYGNPSAWDYGETLVMKSNDVYEDVDYSKTLKEKGAAKGSVQDAAPMGRGKKR